MVIDLNPLSLDSVNKAIKAVEAKQKKIETGAWIISHELAEKAREFAEFRFDIAPNPGPDDHHVYVHIYPNGVFGVRAVGSQVLFIEFGAGKYKPMNGEEWSEVIDASTGTPYGLVPHGAYGRGKGGNPGYWTYKSSRQGRAVLPKGTGHPIKYGRDQYGRIDVDNPIGIDETKYVTFGQEAMSPLWRAKNRVRILFRDVAKEVLND